MFSYLKTNWKETKDLKDKEIQDILENPEIRKIAQQNLNELSNEHLLLLHKYHILSIRNYPQIFLEIIDVYPDMDIWILEVKKRLINGSFKSSDFTYYSFSNIMLALKLQKHYDNASCYEILSKFINENPDLINKISFD